MAEAAPPAGERPRSVLPALALVLNGFIWGISWWPFRQLQAQGLHPLLATAFVYLLSVVLLIAARPGAARTMARHPALWLLAAAAGMTNVGFNWAVTVGDVVRVVLLFYLMPAWTVLLAWLVLGERPTGPSLLRMALAMAGVAIVLKTGDAAWPVPHSLADWLALAGGISFALNNVLLRKLNHVDAAGRVLAMFLGGAIMAGGAAALGLAGGFVAAPAVLDSGWVIGLALSLGFLGSNMALQYGAARLTAHTTALIMLSEVVFASLSSVVLGAAELTARTVAGGGLILVAAAWSAWPVGEPRGAQ
ncbi:DMT family transporter [Ramlibacter sp.]|uniref:DMT family transporter n=1 Tax=Ramlibacter sp. TaxID=1917967 RepID=UPI002C256576|nr:DMT family transporter [Ramlibacter sp.]HWI82171.1 DMT family transporter [Ramlibacter sp.]